MRAILDFLQGYKKQIIIAEAALGSTEEGFKNFGFYDLENDYDVEFVDLNKDDYEIIELKFDDSLKNTLKSVIRLKPSEMRRKLKNLRGTRVRVSKTLLDKDNYIVSPTRLKTHDAVVATLSLKNIVMGSIVRDKYKMHQGIKEINFYLFLLTEKMRPDLAVIDGFKGMEGDGPVFGDPIDSRIMIASTDFLAADRIGLEVMGIDASRVGYLNYCADAGMGEWDLNRIKVLGNSIEECRKKFGLHSGVERQFNWKL